MYYHALVIFSIYIYIHNVYCISIYDDWTASFVFGMYTVDSNILDDTQGSGTAMKFEI